VRRGDITRGFAESEIVLDQVYETSAQYHAYLEPGVALASVDGRGKVTVWSSTQSVFRTQANVHESLGIPMAKIRAISPRVGGGFGGKSEAMVQPIAVALAIKTGRPVRMALNREEDMAAMRSRHPVRTRIRTGAKRDGTFVARAIETWFDGGAYADDTAAVMNFALFFGTGPYRFDHVDLVGHAVYTNKLRAGAFRGFGNPQVTFASECQIDDLAAELGIDPIELRRKNLVRAGDRWIGGQVVATSGLEECIEKVATASRWSERAGKPIEAPDCKLRGLGIGLTAHISGFLSTSAIVRLNEDGSVSLNTGAVDLGQGSDTALAQMCAAGLGLGVDAVNVVAADTDASPYNSGTNASRVTYMVGRAIGQATEVVREKMFKLAADMLECNPKDLELRLGGIIGVEGTDHSVSFSQIAAKSIWFADGGGPIIGTGSVMHNEPLDPKHTLLAGFVSFDNVGALTFGAQVVEVEVDETTGKVEVIEAWCAHDVGRAINPGAVEGQIQGGFVQGLGYALTEEMVWDGGRIANPSFKHYKIPCSLDVPAEIHALIVAVPDPTHPFGAKGIGEPPLIGAAAAIPNAIAAAAGVRVRKLPVTPERMLRALRFGWDGVDA
jgi:CO/xanthine dehydrogenase Mo-binding subunit